MPIKWHCLGNRPNFEKSKFEFQLQIFFFQLQIFTAKIKNPRVFFSLEVPKYSFRPIFNLFVDVEGEAISSNQALSASPSQSKLQLPPLQLPLIQQKMVK